MVKELTVMEKTVMDIQADVKYMRKLLEGNGHEGLCKRVDRHEDNFNQMKGRDDFIKLAIGGGWAVSLVSIGMNLWLIFFGGK